jgi:hypothetical protein
MQIHAKCLFLSIHEPAGRCGIGSALPASGLFGFAEPVDFTQNRFPKVRSQARQPGLSVFNRFAVKK